MSFVRPEPPYYVVVISSSLTAEDPEGYAEMARRMAELSVRQPGYLGRESQTGADGRELTALYYRDAESIAAWKQHPEHLEAQRLGRERWYADYHVEVAKVERAYGFER
ncbi:antibiotic biosynthesis monooxygenase family protein [Saccharothrix obliqua]|uniref:antibiotic biosynthesis monooxygenase family protein n=1 Tax=Saccharothrix obliqua TaxID=2861747 RepID=UPI001C601278|nr:antibiotic biosynthesis monooxygenase [Saccharothrix obliqua]MBW4719969.1 antibiotic biosynthesis monooxygenase [Saccharothrix obliqua]